MTGHRRLPEEVQRPTKAEGGHSVDHPDDEQHPAAESQTHQEAFARLKAKTNEPSKTKRGRKGIKA